MNLSQPILLTQSDLFKVKQDIQQENVGLRLRSLTMQNQNQCKHYEFFSLRCDDESPYAASAEETLAESSSGEDQAHQEDLAQAQVVFG